MDNLFKCLTTHRAQKVFSSVRWNFTCFSLCPLPPVPSLVVADKSLAHSSSFTPIRCLYGKIFPLSNGPNSSTRLSASMWRVENVSCGACRCEADIRALVPLHFNTDSVSLHSFEYFLGGYTKFEACLADIKRFQTSYRMGIDFSLAASFLSALDIYMKSS